jgi:hypothetical protein
MPRVNEMLFEAYVNEYGTLCVRKVEKGAKRVCKDSTPMRTYLGEYRAPTWEAAEDFFSEKMVSMGG